MPPKKNRIIFTQDHLDSLNHWQEQLVTLEKTRYSRDFEKERICRNMINKYIDDVLAYNKNIKEKPKNKV